MKGKLLDAHIDGKDTYVTKQTKYGTYKSKVTLHPEDEDARSEIDGYTFAENKCDIQALKCKAKYFEQRAIGIEHAYNVLLKSGISEYDPTLKKLKRQVDIAWRNYEFEYETYQINRDTFYDRIERLLNYRRQIKNKKNKD